MEPPREVIGLIIWYDQREKPIRIRSSDDWILAPEDGVLLVSIYFTDRRRNFMRGSKHYFWAPHPDGDIWAHANSQKEKIQRRYPNAVVKDGKWVPEITYERVRRQAVETQW